MLKLKTTCSNCEKTYDGALEKCPFCKAENPNADKQTKNMTFLPLLKEIIVFFIGFLGVDLIAVGVETVAIATAKTTNPSIDLKAFVSSIGFNMLVNGLVYAFLFAILLAVVSNHLPRLFKNAKNWKPYVAGIICFASILVFDQFYGQIISFLPIDSGDNVNEQAINSIVSCYPLLSLIIFGLIGPICEEITYRVGLFSSLRRVSKWLAYPITILVFTLIHVTFTGDLLNELINIPFYAFAAFAFSITYERHGFMASTTAHILNNFLSIGLQILVEKMA